MEASNQALSDFLYNIKFSLLKMSDVSWGFFSHDLCVIINFIEVTYFFCGFKHRSLILVHTVSVAVSILQNSQK